MDEKGKTVIRVTHDKDNPYVILNKTFLDDDARLSWKAKGILAYLLAKPDDWIVRAGDLVRRAKDGRDAVYSGLRELREAGYLLYIPIRDPITKTITAWEYHVLEKTGQDLEPQTENPEVGQPQTENPDMANPDMEKPYSTNINSTNNNDTKRNAADAAPASPSKEKKSSQVPLAVQTFRENAHRFPAKAWYDQIAQTVGENEKDLERWGKVVLHWVGLGWNPTNVVGMLDYFKRKQIPSHNGRQAQQRQAQEPVDDLSAEEHAERRARLKANALARAKRKGLIKEG